MRWIEGNRKNPGAPFLARILREKRGLRKYSALTVTASLVLLSTLLLSGAAPEKHLSVYSVAANYSLPLVQRDGRDYVGLLEVLEPLGKVTAKADGARWRLRYNNVEGDFQVGKTRARIQGRDADLGAKFVVENNRGLIPVSSLPAVLPRFLEGRSTCMRTPDASSSAAWRRTSPHRFPVRVPRAWSSTSLRRSIP